MDKFLQLSYYDTTTDIDTVIKVYPNFTKVFRYTDTIAMQADGYETTKPKPKLKRKNAIRKEIDLHRSIRRSKTTVSDIVLCNEFDLFCTFTFARDRFDIQKTKNKMSDWLRSQRKQYGHFDYIIIPEFHKDAKALHFHALLKNYGGVLKFSGHIKSGRRIFNITSYKSGWSTAVKIDDVSKVSSYIKKYITKDMPTFDNKKRFWSSKGLLRPIVSMHSHYLVNPFVDLSTKNLVYKNEGLSIHLIRNTVELTNKIRGIRNGLKTTYTKV